MITLHHLNASRSHRVLWALEELEVDYEIVRHQRDAKTMLAPEALKQIHPLGKAPILVDDETVVVETAVILEHLVFRYGQGRLRPEPGTEAHGRYRHWMHYAEGSLMPLLLLKLITHKIRTKAPLLIRPLASGIATSMDAAFAGPQLELHLGFIEKELHRSPFLAGDELSAADIIMSFPLQGARARAGIDVRSHPKIMSLLTAYESRPAYRRAVDKGGPLELL